MFLDIFWQKNAERSITEYKAIVSIQNNKYIKSTV